MQKIVAVLQAVLISVSILAGFAGCGKSAEDEGPQRLTVAVVPKGSTHEFWKTVHAGAIKASQEFDVDIIWKSAMREDDREAQVAVVESMVVRKVDGIVLAPLDDTALRPAVRAAKAAGIPVVIFDSALGGSDFASYVATDNFAAGKIAGRHLGELLGGKGRIALLRYSEGSDSTTQRESGFLDAIQTLDGIEIVSSNQYAGVTTEDALTTAENVLTRFRNEQGEITIDGIFCPNESVTMGTLRALQNAGVAGKVKLVGFDSSDAMIAAMKAGELHALVVQNPMQMGYLGVQTMVRHLNGASIEPRVDTGATLITPENMDAPEMQSLIKPDIEKWLQ